MTHQNQPPIEDRQSAADMTAEHTVDTSHPKGMSLAELYLELQRLRDEVELWKESARYHSGEVVYWNKETKKSLADAKRLHRALENILLRCIEGDKLTDWISIIQDIASRALVPGAYKEGKP